MSLYDEIKTQLFQKLGTKNHRISKSQRACMHFCFRYLDFQKIDNYCENYKCKDCDNCLFSFYPKLGEHTCMLDSKFIVYLFSSYNDMKRGKISYEELH